MELDHAKAQDKKKPAKARIPVLVVSGFLGSGKTTLVQHLLEHAQREALRVAVISNELGELGIDRSLLGEGGEAYIELEGGCVCCELSNDLVETLQMLYEEVRPDHVVIETSGVALPFDTTLNFWREPVCAWIGDDTAIVVVNAEQIAEGRDLEGTFQDQVSSADLLVLNKIDLVDADALPGVEARLREIEPEAPLVRSERGRVDPALLFPPELAANPRTGSPPAAREHTHEHFVTDEWRAPDNVTEEEVEAALAQPGVLRAKGFVETEHGPQLVQVVGRRIEFSACDAAPDPALLGRVVIIRRA